MPVITLMSFDLRNIPQWFRKHRAWDSCVAQLFLPLAKWNTMQVLALLSPCLSEERMNWVSLSWPEQAFCFPVKDLCLSYPNGSLFCFPESLKSHFLHVLCQFLAQHRSLCCSWFFGLLRGCESRQTNAVFQRKPIFLSDAGFTNKWSFFSLARETKTFSVSFLWKKTETWKPCLLCRLFN